MKMAGVLIAILGIGAVLAAASSSKKSSGGSNGNTYNPGDPLQAYEFTNPANPNPSNGSAYVGVDTLPSGEQIAVTVYTTNPDANAYFDQRAAYAAANNVDLVQAGMAIQWQSGSPFVDYNPVTGQYSYRSQF